MVAGDLYPQFSDTYPEILSTWMPEVQFRSLVSSLNTTLRRAFSPSAPVSMLGGVVALLSGWISEDLALTGPKSRTRDVEAVIEEWNAERERVWGSGEGSEGMGLVRIIPLRRTAYMCLDIQIPDPKVRVVTSPEQTRPGTRGEEGVGGQEKRSEEFEKEGRIADMV